MDTGRRKLVLAQRLATHTRLQSWCLLQSCIPWLLRQFFPRPLDCTYGPFLEDITSRLPESPCPSGTTRQQLLYGMQRAMAGLRLPVRQPVHSHSLPRRSLLLFSSSDRTGYRSHGITNGFAVLERSWWWQRHCIQAATTACCYGH